MMKYPARMLFLLLLLNACNSDQKNKVEKDNYEQRKIDLEAIEKKRPLEFLRVTGKDKRNIIGQTVVKGTVLNNAKIVTYKDIDVKLSFYSATNELLEEDHEILYKSIKPGASLEFKSKYFAPRGSETVQMNIVGASAE